MSCTNDKATLRVLDIIDGTIVDGPGLRTSIYFAGCKHRCPGCHNQQSWDFEAGRDMTIDEILAHVEENQFDVTLSGGDPLFQMPAMLQLCRALKERGVNLWCYTGYTYEQVAEDPALVPILELVDVLVDGRYVEQLRDISLRFKGSSNQRLVDVRHSAPGKVTIWTDNQP